MSEQPRPEMTPEEKKAQREAAKALKKAAKDQRIQKNQAKNPAPVKKEFVIPNGPSVDVEPTFDDVSETDDVTYFSVDAEINQMATEAASGNFTPQDFELTLRRMLVSLGANQARDHLDNFRFYLGLSHLFADDFSLAAVRKKAAYVAKLFYKGVQLPEALLGLEAFLKLRFPKALESSGPVVSFLVYCWQEDHLNGNDIQAFFSAPLDVEAIVKRFDTDVRPMADEAETHEIVRALVKPFLDKFEEESDSDDSDDSESEDEEMAARLKKLEMDDEEGSDIEIDFGAGAVVIDNGDYSDSDSDSSDEE